jgi:hypothetical protein
MNKKNQEESYWKKYFSGWNLIINLLIAFLPASLVSFLLKEGMGLGGGLVMLGPLFGFIYLTGLLREKISKLYKKVVEKENKVENEEIVENNK